MIDFKDSKGNAIKVRDVVIMHGTELNTSSPRPEHLLRPPRTFMLSKLRGHLFCFYKGLHCIIEKNQHFNPNILEEETGIQSHWLVSHKQFNSIFHMSLISMTRICSWQNHEVFFQEKATAWEIKDKLKNQLTNFLSFQIFMGDL